MCEVSKNFTGVSAKIRRVLSEISGVFGCSFANGGMRK